jgi:hypothetical protein
MRASAATSNGSAVLRVRLDYLFVYPVERPGQPATRTRVSVRDTRWIDFGHWDTPNGPLQPWWTVESAPRAPCAAPATVTFTLTSPRAPPAGSSHPENQLTPTTSRHRPRRLPPHHKDLTQPLGNTPPRFPLVARGSPETVETLLMRILFPLAVSLAL